MVKINNKNKKIFYIEKSQFLRSTMEFALKAKGAEIYTVDTIENNFYLLDELSPDLIIFDVETVGDYLQNLSEYSKKAVLVATGDTHQKELVPTTIKAYLTKPIEAKNLAIRILQLLD